MFFYFSQTEFGTGQVSVKECFIMSCNWGTSEAAEPARTRPGALMSPLFCSAEDRDADGPTGRQKGRDTAQSRWVQSCFRPPRSTSLIL